MEISGIDGLKITRVHQEHLNKCNLEQRTITAKPTWHGSPENVCSNVPLVEHLPSTILAHVGGGKTTLRLSGGLERSILTPLN